MCERPDQRIDLLLTDVVMPEMLGTELVVRATAIRPDLKVLYMSGYIHQVLDKLDPADAHGITYVEKPFTAETLCLGVRAALDVESRERA